MKYLITVLLSATFALITGQAPALTNNAAHYVLTAKPTVHTATAVSTEQPQPEKKPTVAVQSSETYASGCETYRSIFALYWSGYNLDTALAICQAESGGNPYAVSNPRLNFDGISDYGLMQIHGEAIFDPSANIARAHQKYMSQGWHAWTTYTSGSYLAFL